MKTGVIQDLTIINIFTVLKIDMTPLLWDLFNPEEGV